MVKTFFYFILILVTACTHKPTFFNRYKDRQLYIKKHIIENSDAAEKYIQNEMNYLHLIFNPSPSSLTAEPEISPECAKENFIGKVKKDQNMIMASSALYVDNMGNAGFCSYNPRAMKVNSIYLHCKRDNYVLRIQFKYEPDFESQISNMEFCEP